VGPSGNSNGFDHRLGVWSFARTVGAVVLIE
jgi:hypothetical protein